MKPHVTVLDVNDGPNVLIHPAPQKVVDFVISADVEGHGGRSPWMFLRLPNGDLMLGVFPQGETYFAVEDAAQYPGPWEDILCCEQCGERPQVVHTKHVGLCGSCAAAMIDGEIT